MGRCRMNPHGIAPRYDEDDAKALRDWTRAIAKARAAYLADTTTRCRKCSRTSAVRRGKKRKEKK